MKTQGDLYKHRGMIMLASIFFTAAFAGYGATKTNGTGTGVEFRPDRGNNIVLEQEKSPVHTENPVDPASMTAAHNHWRSQVGVPGLTWSDTLVDVAQDWADKLKKNGCGFYHSHNGYGENLFMASPLMWSDGHKELQETSPEKVTNSWGNEIKDYNYSNNSCSGVCGHYTQLVWKETTEVGCARSVCDDKSQIWVCSYSPAGNFAGKRPY
ncbi:MAG: SCP-like extracellular [Candidatus Electrothrix sp. MAN1_4]|nr:SCP-like extracellular [Candidatus Electrothrix sp. MAN1_4]